jgi:hypothetical protein
MAKYGARRHAPLKPPEHCAVGDRRRGAPAELILVRNFFETAARLSDLCAVFGKQRYNFRRENSFSRHFSQQFPENCSAVNLDMSGNIDITGNGGTGKVLGLGLVGLLKFSPLLARHLRQRRPATDGTSTRWLCGSPAGGCTYGVPSARRAKSSIC